MPGARPLLYLMTNHCLDHQHSLLSQILDKLKNIDVLILSIMESSVMKVPVLPTPALQ